MGAQRDKGTVAPWCNTAAAAVGEKAHNAVKDWSEDIFGPGYV